jgi:hypothetical protein
MLFLFGLLFLFVFALRSRAAETGVSSADLIPTNATLWTESMLWDEEGDVSSGVGYNNNVLLSATNRQGSAFYVNGLDFVVTRLPIDGWQVVGAVIADDIRYWRNVGTGSEDSFVASLTVERELPAGWQAGLELRDLYEKEVLDITTSEGVAAPTLVQGYGITEEPYVRKNLPAGFWLKLEMPVTRWLLAGPLDDYWDFGPVVTAGCELGSRADVSISYGVSYQQHDEWLALNDEDEQLPQRLDIFQQSVELAWHQYWDANRHWQSWTKLSYSKREDNGAGYFNYSQYQAVEDLHWQSDGWDIKGSAQIAYEDYPVQNPGVLNGQTLYRELLDFSLEVERRLYKNLKGFSKVEYQRAISNFINDGDDYTGTTVSGGLRLAF